MATVPSNVQPEIRPTEVPLEQAPVEELRIYGHSSLFYWWPVWVIGYIMAGLSAMDHVVVPINGVEEWFHPSQLMGVSFTLVFFLVLLITNISLRGLSSVVLVLALLLSIVTISYFDWWPAVISMVPHLSVHMNFGFYMLFSTLVFVPWVLSVFVYDRFSYWSIRPGQISHNYVVGGQDKNYDTRGLVFEKQRQDLFRNWLLGIGAGDLHIVIPGGNREEVYVDNVLFVDRKIHEMQRLTALRPDVPANATVTTPQSTPQ